MWLFHTIEVARQTAIRLLRSRMLLVLAVLGLGSIVFAWLMVGRWASRFRGDDCYGIVTYLLFMQFGLPFAVTFFAVTGIHGDLEDRTATYLFVRPMARSSILLGKWLAVTGVAFAAIAVILAGNYLAVGAVDRPWRSGVPPTPDMLAVFLGAAAMAVPAYAGLGALFSVWFRRPLVTTVAFVLGWEVIASNSPPEAGVRGATIAEPLRRWVLRVLDPPEDGELFRTLAGALRGHDLDRLPDPVGAIAWLTALIIALAIWLHGNRQFESAPRD